MKPGLVRASFFVANHFIAAYPRQNALFTGCMMTSQLKLSLILIALSALSTSPGAKAVGKCDSARTQSTFELINAPAEEMQKNRYIPTAQNCIAAMEFVSRLKSKASNPSNHTQPAPVASNGAYVPKTKDDNTPWRFDMSQNGKRMTSEEFDAWMKAKGIRVATGKPGVEQPAATDCKQAKEGKC